MFSRWKKIPFRPNLFEMAISVILLLIVLFLARPFFSKMLESFERTAVQQIVRQLNAAAAFKMAEYIALDKLKQLPTQLLENPITWLGIDDLSGWDRYRGEVDDLDFQQMAEQSWVYDRRMHRLVYKLGYPTLVENNDPLANRIQFRLVMDYVDHNNDGRFSAGIDSINALLVNPVYAYRWIDARDK